MKAYEDVTHAFTSLLPKNISTSNVLVGILGAIIGGYASGGAGWAIGLGIVGVLFGDKIAGLVGFGGHESPAASGGNHERDGESKVRARNQGRSLGHDTAVAPQPPIAGKKKDTEHHK